MIHTVAGTTTGEVWSILEGVGQSVCLSVGLPVRLSVCLSVGLPVGLVEEL